MHIPVWFYLLWSAVPSGEPELRAEVSRVPLAGVLGVVQQEPAAVTLCLSTDRAGLSPGAATAAAGGLEAAFLGQPGVGRVVGLDQAVGEDHEVAPQAAQLGCQLTVVAHHFVQGDTVSSVFALVDDQGDALGRWSVDGFLRPGQPAQGAGAQLSRAGMYKRTRVALPQAFRDRAWVLAGDVVLDKWRPEISLANGAAAPTGELDRVGRLVGAPTSKGGQAAEEQQRLRRIGMMGLVLGAPVVGALALAVVGVLAVVTVAAVGVLRAPGAPGLWFWGLCALALGVVVLPVFVSVPLGALAALIVGKQMETPRPVLSLEQARAMVLLHNTALAQETGVPLEDVPPEYLPVVLRPPLPQLPPPGDNAPANHDTNPPDGSGETP